jgi:uncharacterized protein YciI
MTTTLIAPLTQNNKLGEGVATSYRPVGDASKGHGTCPASCPYLPEKEGGCYTRKFLVNRQQQLSNKRHDHLDRLKAKGAKLVRLHTSGDFFMPDGRGGHALDVDYLKEVIAWCRTNPDITVWTYTHDVRMLIEAGFSYTSKSFPDNLHIVASVETLIERTIAKAYGYRTAQVIESVQDQPQGTTLCPYDLAISKRAKPKTTCAKCTLCFNPKHTKDIAFIKH